MRLYETHLPVRDTEASRAFYARVVGLEFAYRDPGRDIVFMWIEERKRSMLGLWGPGTARGADFHKCHIAFSLPLPELLVAGERLNGIGIATQDFSGRRTSEPSVIGWMPSAQLYFSDPDGHSLEFISVLDDAPNAEFIGSFSEWKARPGRA